MADRILMTPNDLRSCASTMKSTADQILSEIDSINAKVAEVVGAWEGASQQAFDAAWQQMYNPTLKDTFPQTIQQMADMLEAAANGLEQADESIASSMRI